MKPVHSPESQRRPFLQEDLPKNTHPRTISGDSFEPDWEQRVKITVGPQKADLVGDTDRVIQAAVDYIARQGAGTVHRLQDQFQVEGKLQFADHHDRRIVAAQRHQIAAPDLALHGEAELFQEAFDGKIKRGFQNLLRRPIWLRLNARTLAEFR